MLKERIALLAFVSPAVILNSSETTTDMVFCMADNTGTEIFWILVVRYGDFNFITLIISDKVHSD